MNHVQAFINNISFPTQIEGLEDYVGLFDLESVLGIVGADGNSKNNRNTIWTVPKWAKIGDIVLFMHSKTANSRISALKTQLLSDRSSLDNDYFWTMMNALFRAKQLHNIYGGKIFAVGKISGKTEYYNDTEFYDYNHFKGRVFAPIDSIFLFQNPIDISEFNSIIKVSRQSAITPVIGEQFDMLKEIILKKNPVVDYYFENAKADPVPLRDITDSNWIEIGNKYRRSFFLEEQFREYYVNRLLKRLGDKRTFYRECSCYKNKRPVSFVDNVIVFHGKYLPVEIKLSVTAEKHLITQLCKYCKLDSIKLDKNTIINDNIYENLVLVIDTEKIYIYNNKTHKLNEVIDLDEITCEDKIIDLRESLASILI